MQLHRPLAERVLRPGKDLQRQIDEGGIDRVELVLEAEAVVRRQRPALRQEPVEQRRIEGVGLLLVDARQRRSRHRLHAQMIEPPPLRLQRGNDIAQ